MIAISANPRALVSARNESRKFESIDTAETRLDEKRYKVSFGPNLPLEFYPVPLTLNTRFTRSGSAAELNDQPEVTSKGRHVTTR